MAVVVEEKSRVESRVESREYWSRKVSIDGKKRRGMNIGRYIVTRIVKMAVFPAAVLYTLGLSWPFSGV